MVSPVRRGAPLPLLDVNAGGTIRRRVSRILALPAVVVLLLLTVVAAGQVRSYSDSRAANTAVRQTLAVQALVRELQNERGVTAAVLGGNDSFLNELGPARKLVDRRRAAVEDLVRGGGGNAAGQLRSAVQQLDGLPAVRSATDSRTAARGPTFSYFTDRIGQLSGVDTGLDRSSDQELRRGSDTLQSLLDVSEALAQERAFLNGVFSVGQFGPGEFLQFATMRSDEQEALARFDRTATPSEKAALQFVFGTGAAQETQYFERVALNAFDGRHVIVNPQAWWSGLTTVLSDLQQLQGHVGSEIQIRAHDLQSGSGQRIAGLVVVVLLCFAVSVYLVVLASLSITRPLAALAAEADSVAADRLSSAVRRAQAGDMNDPPQPPPPVQVPQRATQEIRSVASALDRMQTAAYTLATEQALQRRRTIESLTNLGHRNQNLIRRQLGFITGLEREEIDPSALGNLFELDHLATRMRRNAASLLVLVGASSPRQWTSPVPVADVVRAAVSEVEEYRRVGLRRVDEALVTGNAVGAAAHLLSELIENGLTFSPPDSEVEVQGRWLPQGYLIAITDSGIGMSEEDLAVANSRLRGEGDFLAAPTRFLGHFVVGELARETGIQVELRPSPVTGVTARVTLPESVLVRPKVVEAPPSTVVADALTDGRNGSDRALESGVPSLTWPSWSAIGSEPHGNGNGGSDRPVWSPGAPAEPAAPPAPAASSSSTYSAGSPYSGPIEVGSANPVPPVTDEPGYDESFPPGTPSWGYENDAERIAAAYRADPAVPDSTYSSNWSGNYAPDLAQTPPAGIPLAERYPSRSYSAPDDDPTPPRGLSAARLPGYGDPDDGERTRNGLRKRVRRDQRPAGTEPNTTTLRRTPAMSGPPSAAVDTSPSEVRARLTALRAGIQRGQVASAAGHSGADHPEDSE